MEVEGPEARAYLLEGELRKTRGCGMLATVGLVIRRREAILILKRRADDFLPNLWEVPGGHVDPGESVEEAAARELWEETGWRLLRLGPLLNTFTYDGEGARTRQWNFAVTAAMTTPLVHPEHQAHRWVTRTTLNRYRMTADMHTLLTLALVEAIEEK